MTPTFGAGGNCCRRLGRSIDFLTHTGLDFAMFYLPQVGAENSNARGVSMSRFFRLVVVLLLPLFAVSGQNATPPQLQPRPAAPSVPAAGDTDRQITLDVRVTDKSGAPVRGLQKQDFTVLDDKQPQDILSFNAVDAGAAATTDPPVEIV